MYLCNLAFDFSVFFLDKQDNLVPDGQIFKRSDRRTFTSTSPNHFNDIWDFNGNSSIFDKLVYYENFRYAVDPTIDLSEYTLGIKFNDVDFQSVPDIPSWLAIGDDAMEGTPGADNTILFKLSDQHIVDNVTGGDSNTKAIKQFTFIPYDKDVPDQSQYFGKRFASITFGPDNYDTQGPGGIADQNSQLSQFTINSADIKAKSNGLGWNGDTLEGIPLLGNNDFKVAIGGIADKLLTMDYPGGPSSSDFLYHLNINSAVDIDQQLLSQQILVQYTGDDPTYKQLYGDWQPIMLQNDRQWAVTGSADQGLIDGAQRDRFNDIYNNALATDNTSLVNILQFENSMLTLQSSFDKPATNAKIYPNERSIAVAGVTFKDNPKRNQSGVQLNYSDSYDWFVARDDSKSFDEIYSERIWTAIQNHASKPPATRALNNGGDGIGAVWMFDNQLFAWADGSDGPETMAPYSFFERNYQMTADDNIHVLSQGSEWQDSTIIQGNTGSALSFGSYGFTNGAVRKNKLGTIAVHRIAQDSNPDGINGVISNKSLYGKPLEGAEGSGIFDNQVERVKVDNWSTVLRTHNQNQIVDSGVFSALNYDFFFNAIDSLVNIGMTQNDSYGLRVGGDKTIGGENDFGIVEIPKEVFKNEEVKQILYAFGGKKGGNIGDIIYSNSYWDTLSGLQRIPYFDHNSDQTGFIVTYEDSNSNIYTNYIDLRANNVQYIFD